MQLALIYKIFKCQRKLICFQKGKKVYTDMSQWIMAVKKET